MIAYPLLVAALGLSETESGIFLGATIHDVAQVVGAGYIISEEVGDVATFTKLLRVAALVPVVIIISVLVARRGLATAHKKTSLPLPSFLTAFVVIVAINSMGYIPQEVTTGMNNVSRWCLVIAMVALGMKASFKELTSVGWRPILSLVLNTLFLAVLVATWLFLDR